MQIAEVEQHLRCAVGEQVAVHGVLPVALGVLGEDPEVGDAGLVGVEADGFRLLEVPVVEAGVMVGDLDVQVGPAVDVADVLVDGQWEREAGLLTVGSELNRSGMIGIGLIHPDVEDQFVVLTKVQIGQVPCQLVGANVDLPAAVALGPLPARVLLAEGDLAGRVTLRDIELTPRVLVIGYPIAVVCRGPVVQVCPDVRLAGPVVHGEVEVQVLARVVVREVPVAAGLVAEVEGVGVVHVSGALALEVGADVVLDPLLQVEFLGLEVDVVFTLLQGVGVLLPGVVGLEREQPELVLFVVVAVVPARVVQVFLLVVYPLPAAGVVHPQLRVDPEVADVALELEGPLAGHRLVGVGVEPRDVEVLQVVVVVEAQVHEVVEVLLYVHGLPAQRGDALDDLVDVVEVLDGARVVLD